MKGNLLDYRNTLANSIKDSETLFSISILEPQEWIISNSLNNTYKETLFKEIYDNGKIVNRITIVKSKNYFIEYYQSILIEKLLQHINCYMDKSKAEIFIKSLHEEISPKFEIHKDRFFAETFAVFFSIHSSLSGSLIIYQDQIPNESLKNDCLIKSNKKYHELLIYDKKVLHVEHSNIVHHELSEIAISESQMPKIISKYLINWQRLYNSAIENFQDEKIKKEEKWCIPLIDFMKEYDLANQKNLIVFDELKKDIRKYLNQFFETISESQDSVKAINNLINSNILELKNRNNNRTKQIGVKGDSPID